MVDLAIVGGGVNGLAIAREAAARGLDVVLLERNDIAGGATAASSHLIHSGLKYLEHFEFALVAESIRERRLLLRDAPHLTRDYPMLVPFYRGGRRPRLLLRLGMLLHDLMRLDPAARSRGRSRRQVAELAPGISPEGLLGGAVFADAQIVWPERLCVELMLDAERLGARVLTHRRVTGFVEEGGRVTGVRHVDRRTGAEESLAARLTINATGPWIDETLAGLGSTRLGGPTKGSHLVLGPFPGAPSVGVFFEAVSDGRPVFVLPWDGHYLVGSTDLTFDGDLDDIRIGPEEVAYLLAEANHIFPSARLTPADVLYSYSGVRPLPYAGDVTDNSKISRDHQIHSHAPEHPGLVTVIGGKLTTHRSLAEDALDQAARELGLRRAASPTRRRPLPGADLAGAGVAGWAEIRRRVEAAGLPAEQATELVDVYGVRALRVAELLSAPEVAAVEPAERAVAAELVLAATEEKALTIADALLRRLPHRLDGPVDRLVELAAEVMAPLLGWDDARVERERSAFREELGRVRAPVTAAGGAGEDSSIERRSR